MHLPEETKRQRHTHITTPPTLLKVKLNTPEHESTTTHPNPMRSLVSESRIVFVLAFSLVVRNEPNIWWLDGRCTIVIDVRVHPDRYTFQSAYSILPFLSRLETNLHLVFEHVLNPCLAVVDFDLEEAEDTAYLFQFGFGSRIISICVLRAHISMLGCISDDVLAEVGKKVC